MALRVLVADDESGMRLMIKKILEKVEGFQLVGECENGVEALKLFETERPEVVFLDVEMPVLSGIDCAKLIADINPKTIIIFATAHSQYMPEAFQIYAFDYLIKPFKVDRVFQTLDRIKTIHGVSLNEKKILVSGEKVLDKLMIKNKEGVTFVDTKDILLVQREESSTVIYTDRESYTTSYTLTEVQEKLNDKQFMRSHKSYIINLSKVSKIYPYGRWTYVVKLKGTERDALITHDNYEELKKAFNI